MTKSRRRPVRQRCGRRAGRGAVLGRGSAAYIDFTDPAAAAWWRDQVTRHLLDQGMVATWNDNNEYRDLGRARARSPASAQPRPAAETQPVQPLLMTARIPPGPGRGAARATALSWSRDRAWRGCSAMPRHGPATIDRVEDAALQCPRWRSAWRCRGVSNSGHDVGGFAGPAPSPELLVRWVQAGVLMPRFSIHCWNDDRTSTSPGCIPSPAAIVRA